MKIFVIRHGQTELNVQGLINGQMDDVLTPEGKEQAKDAIRSVPRTVRRIYSSSLSRTRQTAEIINAELNLPITFHDELMEVNFGVLSGSPYTGKLKERHIALDYDWRPSGESTEDVRKRVVRILKKIKDENQDGEALIVSHGGIIRMLTFLESGEILDEIRNASLHSFDVERILA
jgi:uncharacterized phosphatase